MNALVLFAGAGGATDGLVRAGVDVRLAIDGWQAACVAHRRWHPKMYVVRARVEDAHRVARGPVDLIWASPSCKPYSMANRTPLRGRAHPEFYDLAFLVEQAFDHIGARWLVVENVGGLVWSVEGKAELALMREAATRRGLRWTVSVVNSNTVGVAQIRRRVFIVVGPEFVRVPHGTDYIPPANAEAAPTRGERAGLWKSGQRFAGKGCVASENGLARSRMTRERWGEAQTMIVRGGGGGAEHGDAWRRLKAQRAVGREDRRTAAQIGVRATEHDGSRRDFRDTQGRTLADCCALQMVPEHVVAGFSKRVAHELVGNAVPAPLAEHVMRHVLRADAEVRAA